MIRLAELNEVRDMEEFFSKYAKIIKFGMYTLVVLMLLSIVFLFVQTSPIWGNILSDNCLFISLCYSSSHSLHWSTSASKGFIRFFILSFYFWKFIRCHFMVFANNFKRVTWFSHEFAYLFRGYSNTNYDFWSEV